MSEHNRAARVKKLAGEYMNKAMAEAERMKRAAKSMNPMKEATRKMGEVMDRAKYLSKRR